MAASSWGSAACDSLMVNVAFGRHRNCFQSLLRSQTLHCASPFSPSRRRGIGTCQLHAGARPPVVAPWCSRGEPRLPAEPRGLSWLRPRAGLPVPAADAHTPARHPRCAVTSAPLAASISGILLAVRSQSEGRATRNVPSYIRSHCPPLSRTALCTCVLILIPLKCSAYLSLCPSFQPPPPSPASGEHFLQVGTESQSKLCVFLNSRRSKNGQSQCFARSLLLHCGCFSAHSLKGEVVEI